MRPRASASGSRSSRASSAANHVQDSQTGRMLSITIWDSEESMEALKGETPPGGSLGIVTDREELFDVVEEY